ncbi:MAG: LysR family transcriptional regulator [Chloroflexota bacterium]
MEIRQLATFRVVAETLSFSRAATTLGYAQSTVSAQIQGLEKELAITLFDRLGKQVVLTQAGHQLLGYADKILALTQEAGSVVTDSEAIAGSLTIYAPGTLCAFRLPPILRLYRERYPQVEITIPAESDPNLAQRMHEGKVDIAFSMEKPFQSPYLCIEPLIKEPLILATWPDHPLMQRDQVSFADFQDETMILTEPLCTYRNVFEKAISSAGIKLHQPMGFYSVEAIKQCVMAGLGITFLPQVAIQRELDSGAMAALPWAGPEFWVMTQMMWHKDKWLSPTLQAFIDIVREVIGNKVTSEEVKQVNGQVSQAVH